MQPKGGLDRSQIAAFDCEPRRGTAHETCAVGVNERCAANSLIVPARKVNTRLASARTAREEHDHGDTATQSEAEHYHQQDWHYVRGNIHSEQIYARVVELNTGKHPLLAGTAVAEQLDYRAKRFTVSARNVEKLELRVGDLIESEKRNGGGLIIRRANTICNVTAGPPAKYYRTDARQLREERKRAA